MTAWARRLFEVNNLPIAKGEVNDHSVVFLSGVNDGVQVADVPESIWNVTGPYPWTAWNGGGKVLYLASSNASDIKNVLLSGLDTDYNPITLLVQLSGTTYVNTGTTVFYRLNSAIYLDGDSSNLGTISIRIGSSLGTLVGKIDPSIGATSMSIYTVPAGYTAYSMYGDFSCNKGEGAQLNAMWRFYGSSFIRVYSTEIYEQHISAMPPIPGAIPEKTDIDNVVRFVTSNGTRIYSNQQLLLVKNNALHT